MTARERFEVRPLASEQVAQVATVLGLARLEQGDGYYLVAWLDATPVGHAYLAMTAPAELQDVSVRPEFRRRGVATALTSAAERDVVGEGRDYLRLHVSAQDSAGQALYQGCGYRDTGLAPIRVEGTILIRTGPIEVDDTLLTWEKRLTS